MTGGFSEYATAIFALGLENKKERLYLENLKLISSCLTEEYLNFLSSPSIMLSERLSAVDEAFLDKVEEQVLSFFKLVIEKRKTAIFFDVIKEYEKLLLERENVCFARVKSAVLLDDAQRNKLKNKLEKILDKTVVLNCEVDESLIGGVVVSVDDRIYDGSILKKLKRLKETL